MTSNHSKMAAASTLGSMQSLKSDNVAFLKAGEPTFFFGNKMNTKHSAKYKAHAADILDSVQSLKSDEVAFDFVIKAGEDTFHAHKLILAACSDYFRAMFTHDTKEAQTGEMELQDVQPHAVKQSLEFMYTGEFVVTIETVREILHLASILQLTKVTQSCFEYLSRNLMHDNCIFLLKLLELYPCSGLKSEVQQHCRSHFSNVTNSEDFKQLLFADAKEHISEYSSSDYLIWGGAVSWIEYDRENREQRISDFMQLLSLQQFPCLKLLEAMWDEPSFVNSADCKDIVIQRLFSCVADLEKNITTENCLFLKHQADRYKHITKDAARVIFQLLQQNLGQFMTKNEFLQFSKEDVLSLFCSDDTEYMTAESVKWNAVIKWLNHNSDFEGIFPQLIKSIKFDFLSMDFIRTVVRNEPLVKKYEQSEFLFDIMASHKNGLKNFIVVLFQDGTVKKLDISNKTWINLPYLHLSDGDCPSIKRLASLNGNICFLNGGNLLHLTKTKCWVEKAKLQYVPSANARVLECHGCLFLIEDGHVSKYDPEQNAWEDNLPCSPVTPDIVTASEKYIYAMAQGSGVIRFDPALHSWQQFCIQPILSPSHLLVVNSQLYALSDNAMEVLNHLKTGWTKKTKCESIATNQQYFEVDSKIASFGRQDSDTLFLEMYDCSCDFWMKSTFPRVGKPSSNFNIQSSAMPPFMTVPTFSGSTPRRKSSGVTRRAQHVSSSYVMPVASPAITNPGWPTILSSCHVHSSLPSLVVRDTDM